MKLIDNAISPVKYLPCSVSVEPVYNVLNSLSLLNTAMISPTKLNSWITKTIETLDPEVHQRNRIILGELRDVLAPAESLSDFPSYVQRLASMDLCEWSHQRGQSKLHTLDVQHESYSALEGSIEMKNMIISHLEYMWKVVVAPEWNRSQRKIQQQVDLYNQYIREDATAVETFRLFTGRNLLQEGKLPQGTFETIILVPSLHNGRHVTFWPHGRVLRIFFSAPPDYEIIKRSSAIGQDEIHIKLKMLSSALADEIRVGILELLAQNNELATQDIMKHFNISQPGLSRHLKQLVNAGYVCERRSNSGNSNLYSFNTLALDDAFHALELLKAGLTGVERNTIQDTQEEISRNLQHFFDARGRLTTWPPLKERDRILILQHLATYFEIDQKYSVKEVSDILMQHLAFQDPDSIRYALHEYGFMQLEYGGSHYRRVTSELSNDERIQYGLKQATSA